MSKSNQENKIKTDDIKDGQPHFQELKNTSILNQDTSWPSEKSLKHTLMSKKILQKQIIKLYFGQMKGLKSIAEEIKASAKSLRKMFDELGIWIPSPGSLWVKVQDHCSGKFNIELSEKNKELIIGSLLSGGNLRVQSKKRELENNLDLNQYQTLLQEIDRIREIAQKFGDLSLADLDKWNTAIKQIVLLNTANLRFDKGVTEKEWIKLLWNKFSKKFGGMRHIRLKRSSPNNAKWIYSYETSSSFQFLKLWQEWYMREDSKIIKKLPEAFKKLTPNILLHWYLGSGNYKNTNLTLKSLKFTANELNRLRGMLNDIGVATEYETNSGIISIFTKDRFFEFLSKSEDFEKAKVSLPEKFDPQIENQDIVKIHAIHSNDIDMENRPDWN